MSLQALGWAVDQRVVRATDKLVLMGLADRHNTEKDAAYPSLAWLCEFSSLDRKTVISALDRLEAASLISDSGLRTGKTGQVKVYRLSYNSAGKGIPKTEPLVSNSTDIPSKESQKRNPEPVREPIAQKDKPSEPRERKGSPTRLKEDWSPSVADLAYAKDRGFGPRQTADIAEDFRTHFTLGNGRNKTHLKWEAAWQQWVRREKPRADRDDDPADTAGPSEIAAKAGEGPEATDFRRAIAKSVGERSYRSWFDPLNIRVDGDRLALIAQTSFAADHVRNNFGAKVQGAAKALFAGSREVVITAATGRRAA